jgi:hypothetical protein
MEFTKEGYECGVDMPESVIQEKTGMEMEMFWKHQTKDHFESKRTDAMCKWSMYRKKSVDYTLGHAKRRKNHQHTK